MGSSHDMSRSESQQHECEKFPSVSVGLRKRHLTFCSRLSFGWVPRQCGSIHPGF